MSKLYFDININAPRTEVERLMLAQDTYQQWTAPFCEGSYYEGSWDKGARILFLGPDRTGMYSVIAEHRPAEYLSIKHEGCLMNGVESDRGPDDDWSNAFENYTFVDRGKGTTVKVDIDVPANLQQYMNDAWPKALGKLKAICESTAQYQRQTTAGVRQMPKAIYVNMAVNDLKKSKAFFSGIGLSFNAQFTNDDAAALVISDNIFAMLHTHESFRRFTKKDIVDSRAASEVLLALEVDSRAEVDEMLDRVVKNGGKLFRDAQDHGFMYERSFEDVDGHVWEAFWIDVSKHPGA